MSEPMRFQKGEDEWVKVIIDCQGILIFLLCVYLFIFLAYDEGNIVQIVKMLSLFCLVSSVMVFATKITISNDFLRKIGFIAQVSSVYLLAFYSLSLFLGEKNIARCNST